MNIDAHSLGGSGGSNIRTQENLAAERAVERKQDNAPAPAADGSRSSAHGAADTLQLTDRVREVQQLQSNIADQSAIDTQRVEAIRLAINEGSFEINADRIAEKLIDLEAAF